MHTISATEAAIAGLEMCRAGVDDVYGIGARLYALAAGAGAGDVIAPGRSLRDVRPDLPEVFVRVVERAMAPDPGDRYQSVGMLEAALSSAALATREEMLEPEPAWRPMAAAAAVLFTAALAGTAYCGSLN